MAMGKGYKAYDKLKQKTKPLVPKKILRHGINYFHFLEAVAANVIYSRPSRGMKIIGVTGTNGKTTTTILIGAILESAGYRVGINSTALLQVGDKKWDNDLSLTTANPFQLQRLIKDMRKEGVDWLVMEVASHSLVQHRVFGLKFDAAVMTNLTRDHLDYHGTMEEYAKAKGKLFANFPQVIALNRDDEWFDFYAKYPAVDKISYGVNKEAECRITGAKLSLKGTKLKLSLNNHVTEFHLKLLGKFNAMNATAAAATAYAMHIDIADIKKGLESVESVPGRVEMIDEGQDFTVIIDHAHTTDALENLFGSIHMLLKGRMITVIGADGDRDPGKREPIGKLAAENSQAVIVTDQEPYTEDPNKVRAAVMKGVKSVKHGVVSYDIPDRREAIKKALSLAKKGDVVLIPGLGNQLTRGMKDGKMEWDDRQVTRELLQEHLSHS